MSEVIRARGIGKSFGAKRALDGFDLELDAGEILGFVGPNGAGKSTFLRILVDLHRRDEGELAVLGLDPQRHSLRVRRHCSYLPGEVAVYQYMTGREFLDFALSFHGDRIALPVQADELFALPMKRKIRDYSAGMKQKLALLATLQPDADLYLLDEPDRALDATARLQLRELLHWLRGQGKSVLLSSHHLAEIDALADRSLFLFDGRNVPDGEIEAARHQLRHELRLRLSGEGELPTGTTSVEELPDGSLRVCTEGDPLQWLQHLPAERVQTVELGATRVEEIYRVLSEGRAAEVQP